MNRPVAIALAFFSGVALTVSTSNRLMDAVFRFRISSELLRTDKYYYGDLFGISYLSKFRTRLDLSSSPISAADCGCPRTIHLFIAGDSYLSDQFVKSGDIFCGVGKYDYLRVNFPEKRVISLDTASTNILLIETVERDLRLYKNWQYLTGKLLFEETGMRFSLREINSLIKKALFNEINRNLEFNLFSYSFFTPLKELKASLNYRIFKRISADVCIAPDSSMLLYLPTVDPNSVCSSFNPVSDEEVDSIVKTLNQLRRYYIRRGFDEVYFSAIPNPVSILYPGMGNYNALIPRLQGHPGLDIPLINVYEIFRSTRYRIYFENDTHWNMKGFSLWLSEFNKKLKRHCN